MKKIIFIIILIGLGTGHVFAQGIVNKGTGIWIGKNTTLRIHGGYTNQQTGSYVGLISNDGTISITRHWINEAATDLIFQGDKGAVLLTGADQTITGNTQFYDLTKSSPSSNTLSFQAGSTTTVKNLLTLEGTSGQPLYLRSSVDESQWNISPPATRILRYLDIKDSNNSSGTEITLETSCTNSNGNTNWRFTPVVDAWPSSADDITYGQSLSESILNGGSATNGPNPVAGTFVFVNAEQKPATGTLTHPIKFVPSDSIYIEVTGGTIAVTVNKKALSATADDKTRDYGQENPVLTVTYNGFITGEGPAQLTTQPTLSCAAISSSAAGDYPIIISGGEAVNYAITHVNGTLTVNPIIPTLSTADIANIATTSADSGGNVTDWGGITVTARGVCWKANATPTFDDCDGKVESGSGTGEFTSNASALTPGITYHLRAWATNSAGTAYGEEKIFTTYCESPVATIASEIFTTDFKANWETTANASSYKLDVSENSDFSTFLEGYANRTVNEIFQTVSGLDPSSTYYYRVRAVNSIGAESGDSNTITVMTLDVKTISVPTETYPDLASAILAANNGDTIQLAAGTYEEYGFTLERDISILGESAKTTILDADDAGRLFNIPSDKTVTIKNLSIQNGTEAEGAGILNYGSLIIENCEIRNCLASQVGGAINNLGELSLKASTLADCVASANGGAIHNSAAASITMENVTIASGNEELLDSNGIYNKGELSMDSCLLRGYSIGLKTVTGESSLSNSIVAGNETNLDGEWNDLGSNIVEGDPGLMSLDYYEGSTRTCALKTASPALDKGSSELATDQRGVARPQNDFADVGPFESRFYSVEFTPGSNGSITGELIQSVVEYNPSKEVTASPASNYHFLDWTNEGELYSTANPLTILKVTENLILTANFSKDEFKILFTSSGQGSLEGETNQTVAYQDICSAVEAIPESTWRFDKWLDQSGNEYLDNPIVFGPVVSSAELTAYFSQIKYTVTAKSSAGGECQPSGDSVVFMGESITIQIVPDGGNYTENVIVDGESVGAISSYTFENVTSNHELIAKFGETSAANWTISSSKTGDGTISPNGDVVVEDGGSVTFSMSPDDGWRISDVVVDKVSQGAVDTYTFTNVSENHAILAEFEKIPLSTFVISASAGADGDITPEGENSVTQGNSLTFLIEPRTGYRILQVFVDNVPVGAINSYTFYEVSANHSIHAVFVSGSGGDTPHVIKASAGDGGRISPPGFISVIPGNDVTFTITPENGWRIADVLVDQKSVTPVPSYTFSNVTGDHSIHASFAPITYTITSTTTEGGEVSPSGVTTANHGDMKTFFFIPDGGFYIKDVIIDENSVGAIPSYTFPNISSNHSIHVIFTKTATQHVQIVSSSSEGGSISPSGLINVPVGNNATFTMTANDGFMVEDVKVDGNSVGGLNSYSFKNVSSDHLIYAKFKEIPVNKYLISSSAAAGGSIAPSGQILVDAGDSLTFTFDPEEYYELSDILVDDSSVGTANSYTLENISANHKIEVEFKLLTYRVVTIAGEHGAVSPSGEIVLDAGDSQLFVFTPDAGYHVENVVIDGTPHGEMVEYEFTDIRSDHILEVSFAPGEELYHVIHSTASKGGTVSPLGRISVKNGENANFVILPKYGLKTKDVLVDGVSVGVVENYSFNNVSTNHTLSAVFEKDESGGGDMVLGISVNNAKGGWLTPQPGKYAVTENSTVKLEAVASDAFIFEGWSVIGSAILTNPRSPVIELDVIGPTEITANFAPIISQVRLITRCSPVASASVSPEGTVLIQAGEPQQLLASPAQNFEFNQWVIMSGVGEIDDLHSSQTTLTASTNIEVTAVFFRKDINANVLIGVDGPGVVTPQGELNVPVGSVLDVEALAATGHKFIEWESNEGGQILSPYSSETKVIVAGNCQLTARFAASSETSLLTLSDDDTGILRTESIATGLTRDLLAHTPAYKVFDYWNCLESLEAVTNPYAPRTSVEVNEDLTVEAFFAKNILTDSSLKRIKLDIHSNTMIPASGKMKMSLFPCSRGTFDPSKDKLEFCFNGIPYLFPEDSIRQIGKTDLWIAKLKDESGVLSLCLDPEKGEFKIHGKRLLLDNASLNGDVNCSLQVGSRNDFYRLSPWKKLHLKFKKQPGDILEKLPVAGKELEEFSIAYASVRIGSNRSENNFLKIRKMTFALPAEANFDPSTEAVSIQLGDLSVNIPPGMFKPRASKGAYHYRDRENRISIFLNTIQGKGLLTLGNLKNLPCGCDDGRLDVYLRLGDYAGGVRLFFTSVKKGLLWNEGGKGK